VASVAALTCLAVADDMLYSPARVVLMKVAIRALPLLAALFLLQLGVLTLLGQRRLREAVRMTGTVILAVLLVGMSVAAYASLQTDQRFIGFQRTRRMEPFAAGIMMGWVLERMTPEERAPRTGAETFHEELYNADRLARRALQLAGAGIPADGPLSLLRRDPLTRGKELFGQHCASCHDHGQDFQSSKPTAPDLAGFGTSDWIGGLLWQPGSPHYFGNTKLRTMSNWIKKTRARAQKEHEEANLEADLDVIARWLGSHPLQAPPGDEKNTSLFAQGYRAFADRCAQCHTYKQIGGDTKGPDLTGYGDAEWIRMMILAPYDALRYGSRNTMPAFRDLEAPTGALARHEVQQARERLFKEQLLARNLKEDDPQAQDLKSEIDAATRLAHLSDLDRELIIRWLLHDYRVVFGGNGP
jgi:mono/diheme cytochrome c family protein